MSSNARRVLMALMIAATLVWIVVLVAVFIATGEVGAGWLLTTIVLYAAMFVLALLMLFLDVPEGASGMVAAAPSGAPQESLFSTRRGAVEIDRRKGVVAEIVVNDAGGTIDLDQAETALDALDPAPEERSARREAPVASEPERAPLRRSVARRDGVRA